MAVTVPNTAPFPMMSNFSKTVEKSIEFGGTKNDVAKLSPGGFWQSQTVSLLFVSGDTCIKKDLDYFVLFDSTVENFLFTNSGITTEHIDYGFIGALYGIKRYINSRE